MTKNRTLLVNTVIKGCRFRCPFVAMWKYKQQESPYIKF